MIINIEGIDRNISVDDSSYRYRTIMGENEITIHFGRPGYMDIPIGSYCDFEGERYTMHTPQIFKKNGPRDFEYTLVFKSAKWILNKYKFRDLKTVGIVTEGSMRLKFSATANPAEHLQRLVDNLNVKDSGWTIGTVITATEKPLSFNHNYCIEALRMMAEAFETEYEIVGKTISLKKIEYNKETPLALSYGKGNGFKPGVGRSNFNDKNPIEILYVQGGERNIDKKTYGSSELLLPISQQLIHEGRTYISSSDGLSIQRADKALVTHEEGSTDLSNIYPSRIGTVSSVVAVDVLTNKYDIIDNTIPEILDFHAAIIAGQKLTIKFQDGMLAGKEFDAKYIHATRRFELVKQELDGQTMPNAIYAPVAGNTYIVLGIALPTAYVCNNELKTGASWEMFREAAEYLYQNEDPRFNFTGELDGIWAKQNWTLLNLGSKIILGGFVSFSDPQFQNGTLIRISAIKDSINNPHSPTIELSNMPVVGTIASDLGKINTNEAATLTLLKEVNDIIRRRNDVIIDFVDDRFKADELVRTRDLDPRMLSYDAGTPQFSLTGGEIETNVDGLQNKITIDAGTLISHNYNALDKEGIQALKDANIPYDPTMSWTIPATTINLAGDGEHFIYLKIPITE